MWTAEEINEDDGLGGVVETYGGLSDIDYIDNGARDMGDGARENDKL